MYNSYNYYIFKYIFMFNSDRTENGSVRKKFIRTDFLFIDYRRKQCLHKI